MSQFQNKAFTAAHVTYVQLTIVFTNSLKKKEKKRFIFWIFLNHCPLNSFSFLLSFLFYFFGPPSILPQLPPLILL